MLTALQARLFARDFLVHSELGDGRRSGSITLPALAKAPSERERTRHVHNCASSSQSTSISSSLDDSSESGGGESSSLAPFPAPFLLPLLLSQGAAADLPFFLKLVSISASKGSESESTAREARFEDLELGFGLAGDLEEEEAREEGLLVDLVVGLSFVLALTRGRGSSSEEEGEEEEGAAERGLESEVEEAPGLRLTLGGGGFDLGG